MRNLPIRHGSRKRERISAARYTAHQPQASVWKRLSNHPERLISLAAPVVASGALCVSFWQLDIARKHNVLSVRPYVMVTPHAGAGKEGLYLSNEGIGLGVLTYMSVTVGEKVYSGLGKSQWPKILLDLKLEPLCFSIAWPTEFAAVRPGLELEILGKSKKFGSYPICAAQMRGVLTRKDIKIELHYKSLYGEEHIFTGDGFLNL